MLGDDAFEPTRLTLGKEPLALLERRGMEQPDNVGALNEMAESALAVLQEDGVQVFAVELHEVKGPGYEIVLCPFVYLSMELFEVVRMN
jgi:hypothetical protein